MKSTAMTLDRVPPNLACRILRIDLEGGIRRRLQDLGLICQAQVKRLFAAPAGSPIAYEIQGAVVALRREDAACITVEEVR